MTVKVLIVHADGEEPEADKLAEPLRTEDSAPEYQGTVLVGDSFTEEASELLTANDLLDFCGTITGTGPCLAIRYWQLCDCQN